MGIQDITGRASIGLLGVLLASGVSAAESMALADLQACFDGHESLQLSASVTMRFDAEIERDDVHWKYEAICHEDRFAVLQWTVDESGEVVRNLSAGWDGETAWRVDARPSILTHWAQPRLAQAGLLPNPLYIGAAVVAQDLVTPGLVLPAEAISDATAWLAAVDRSNVTDDGRVIVGFSMAAEDGLESASESGDPFAEVLRGGWFELVPAVDAAEGFPIAELLLHGGDGQVLFTASFEGVVNAEDSNGVRRWPARVECRTTWFGQEVMSVVYEMEHIRHDQVDDSACAPDFTGIRYVVDGDAPWPGG